MTVFFVFVSWLFMSIYWWHSS